MESYDDYEEIYSTSDLFADDVLASPTDLAEINISNVDEAAVAVDLTTTNSITDFNIGAESLTTLTLNSKDKK